jgi:uncharacterized membrane protein
MIYWWSGATAPILQGPGAFVKGFFNFFLTWVFVGSALAGADYTPPPPFLSRVF